MTRRVAFTEDAARRISAATRAYERGNRDQPPIKFRDPGGDGGDPVRLGKTTAKWAKNTKATIDIYEQGTAPNETANSPTETIEAVNKCYPVDSGVWVLVARCANGEWYLVDASTPSGATPNVAGHDLTTVSGYDAYKTQALVHENGAMKWVSIEACP